MSHSYEQQMFDAGALHGLEVYCVERQRLGTFDPPNLIGYMRGCTSQSPFWRGMLHGIALGAQMQYDAIMAWGVLS